MLIDEVELHLHPGWQRSVVGRLLETFPGCQFVLTTHSPQVIASVPSSAVRLLRDGALEPIPSPTEGRDSNAILTELMDVAERPDEMGERLLDVERLIAANKLEEARVALQLLAKTWSEDTAEVVRLRTMIEFLEGDDALD